MKKLVLMVLCTVFSLGLFAQGITSVPTKATKMTNKIDQQVTLSAIQKSQVQMLHLNLISARQAMKQDKNSTTTAAFQAAKVQYYTDLQGVLTTAQWTAFTTKWGHRF